MIRTLISILSLTSFIWLLLIVGAVDEFIQRRKERRAGR